MHTIEDVKSDYKEVFEFKAEFGAIYKRDKDALKKLNKIFGTDFKVLYRRSEEVKTPEKTKENTFNCDGEEIFIVTSKGSVVEFSNSEWCSITVV